MAKSNLPKPGKTASGWSDFRAGIRLFREHWLIYGLVIVVVSLPIDLMQLSATFSADATIRAVAELITLFMYLAVLWVVIQHIENRQVKLGDAYHNGTAGLLRFILVSLALAGMLLFAGLGLFVYGISLQSTYALPASAPEQLLVGFGCALVASPSIYFIIRFGLAYVGVIHDDLRPIAALRRSWRLTRRRFWLTFGRGLQLILYMAIVAIPAALIAAALVLLHAGVASGIVFELMFTVLALPIANAYLVRMYRNYSQTVPEEFINPAPRTDLFDD